MYLGQLIYIYILAVYSSSSTNPIHFNPISRRTDPPTECNAHRASSAPLSLSPYVFPSFVGPPPFHFPTGGGCDMKIPRQRSLYGLRWARQITLNRNRNHNRNRNRNRTRSSKTPAGFGGCADANGARGWIVNWGSVNAEVNGE